MNDDLERRLRHELRRGALPTAPEALRDRLNRLPAESRGSRLTGLFGGLRLAALGTAAAVAIAFVLVVRSLPGPAGILPGSSLGASATSSPTPTTVATPTPSTSLPTSVPVSPSAPPSPSEILNCSGGEVVQATTQTVAQISDVRVGTHPGYDRIVFEFAGTDLPQFTIAVAQPPFVEDASGKPVVVGGNSFLSLKLFHATGDPTYAGPSSFSPGYPSLVSLVNSGDYEGYVTWIAGLSTGEAPCFAIATLSSPTRIVVDIQAP